MEGSVIKSPAQQPNTNEILNEDNPKVKTIADLDTKLVNTSSIPVDNKDKINQNMENPNAADGKNESENKNKKKIVEGLKDPEKPSSMIITENGMTKPSKSRVSCKKEITRSISDDKKTGKTMPLKNTSRKVLGVKQIQTPLESDEPGIFLRSKRKKSAELLGRNFVDSNSTISDENKDNDTRKNRTDIDNAVQSNEKTKCKENLAEENVLKGSGDDLNPQSLASEKQNTANVKLRKSIPYESLSLMEKILIREHEMLESMSERVQTTTHQTNSDAALNNIEKSSADRSSNPIKNDVAPKKKFHRRKCSEPLKNERVQTRQSRSIMLMQNKNEYKYFPQVPTTVKYVPIEPDKESVEKMPVDLCTIIRKPDINSNDQKMEISSDENQNPIIGSVDKEIKQELGCKEDQDESNAAKKSPADKIPSPLGSKNDSKCTPTESRVSTKETSSTSITKPLELSKKRRQENADENPKRKLRHVNAEAMPVYTSKIALTKNYNKSRSIDSKSLLLSQTRNNGGKSSVTDHKSEEKRKSPVIEKETQPFSHTMSLRSKSDKSTEHKFMYLSNTDSEDTLSNVESIPNSPAREVWPKLSGKKLKLGNKRVKLNPPQSSPSRKEPSSDVNSIPMDGVLSIAENDHHTELGSASKSKCSQAEISTTTNCSINRGESGLRYYVETSATLSSSCVSDGADKNMGNDIGKDDLGEPQETPWLRHYERPNKTGANTTKNFSVLKDARKKNSLRQNQNLYHPRTKDVETTKKTSYKSLADNSLSDNPHAARGFTLTNQSGKLPQADSNQPIKKRGRPRKQDPQKPEVNLKGNERKRRAPSTPLNGSGLTKLELERLFFKFLQDGHFRVDPEKPTIIIQSDDLWQKYSARIRCYDPRRNFSHPSNAEPESNTENESYPYSQQHLPAYNDCNTFHPSNNSSSAELGQRPRTINPNSYNFSNEYVGQTTHVRNQSPCSSTQTNTHPYSHSDNSVMNTSGFSATNYLQSGYGTTSSYHQNFYNNNANVMGNNSYSDSYSGYNSTNSNVSLDNTSAGTTAPNLLPNNNTFEDDFNFILNQHQNSTSCREIDRTMSNENTVSSNSTSSMQNSPTNNVNLDWNPIGTNQHLNSANGLPMDFNSNNVNESNQPIATSPDFNNVMNNANSMMNAPNPWMNRSNHMMNPRFPVLPPWHTPLQVYNPYFNNDNTYYNNMFNPYSAFMDFAPTNGYIDSKNSSMGMNNSGPWMQNTLPGGDGHSTFNSSNTDFSNMNSGSQQENTLNEGMNLSLSSETNVTLQTNSIKLDCTDLDVGHENGFNSNMEELREDTLEQIKVDDNKDMQESYGEATYSPYSSGYGNDIQSIDFDDIKISNDDESNADNQQQQNLPQIEDYMSQRSDSFESCINQNYGQSGSPSCEIVTDQSRNRQTEMCKLRQELADFTRQYSEDQLSPGSQIPQSDEIFI